MAELADALDSKSTGMLSSDAAVAVLLPIFEWPSPLRQIALESLLIAGRLETQNHVIDDSCTLFEMNVADFNELSESEKPHFYKFRCGEMVDMRQLDDVLFHETDHRTAPGHSIRRFGQNRRIIAQSSTLTKVRPRSNEFVDEPAALHRIALESFLIARRQLNS